MDKKSIFDKNGTGAKKPLYYIMLGLCIVAIGAISFISYKSVQNSLSNNRIENETPDTSDMVDSNLPNVTEPVSEPTPVVQPETTPQPEEQPEEQPEVKTKSYIMPVNGEVTTGFSLENPVYSQTLKDWRIHDGIDISAELGTDVVAVNDGAVESIAADDMYGIVVVIKHTDGRKSLYANLDDSVELEENQVINRGDTVGKVGNTAVCEISDGPHLHFEMSENGNKSDPLKLIKQ